MARRYARALRSVETAPVRGTEGLGARAAGPLTRSLGAASPQSCSRAASGEWLGATHASSLTSPGTGATTDPLTLRIANIMVRAIGSATYSLCHLLPTACLPQLPLPAAS